MKMKVEWNRRWFSTPWYVDYGRGWEEEGDVDTLCAGCGGGSSGFGRIASVELDGTPARIHRVIGGKCPQSTGVDI
jgi:hypothetical protein